MTTHEMTAQGEEDFITIIAPSMAEVMASFKAQGLADRDYSIVHRGGRHSFTLAGGEALFNGAPMVAATFARRAQAGRSTRF